MSNLGAAVVAVNVPDRAGKLGDVVLGYGKADSYFGDGPCMGKCPGRFANRIAAGKFTLDGKSYTLPINNGPNHLHGGPEGFQNKVWVIGPEGGFSEQEINNLVKQGFIRTSLGKRILRAETAAIYALSVLGYILEK